MEQMIFAHISQRSNSGMPLNVEYLHKNKHLVFDIAGCDPGVLGQTLPVQAY